MRTSLAFVVMLSLVGCHWHRRPKSFTFRPLETGTFGKYKIDDCTAGGHVVRLAYEPDERGEAGSRERIDTYRKRYLIPKLDNIDILGWGYEDTCAHGGLSVKTPDGQQGEALHVIGETLAANPTDIEVTVVPEHPASK